MKGFVVEKWSDKDKKLMVGVSNEIYGLLNRKIKDKFMIAHCVDIFNKCYKEQIGLYKIYNATKEGKLIKEYSERVLSIIDGMSGSDCNLLLFRNCPEVLMQYYIGLYFEKPTFVICEECDKENFDRLLKSNFVKQVEYVKNICNQQELTKAMERMRKNMEVKR